MMPAALNTSDTTQQRAENTTVRPALHVTASGSVGFLAPDYFEELRRWGVEECPGLPAFYETPVRRSPRTPKAWIPDALRWEVWERDDFTCQRCGSRRRLSIDHIVPESRGGPTVAANLRTLCVRCNARKGVR